MMTYFMAKTKMTDRQIAAKIKMSPAYISMIRRGYIPSFEKADALAKIMNCSVEVLFPRYIRTSQLPSWKEMKFLLSEGHDMSAYGRKDISDAGGMTRFDKSGLWENRHRVEDQVEGRGYS